MRGSIAVLCLTLAWVRFLPAKTVVFWQEGFPTVGSQPVSRDALVKALDDADTAFAGIVEHISDHDLERYYLGMVPNGSPEEEAIEEHLLWCRECVARGAVSDRYVDAIRAAIISGNLDLE